MKVEYLVEEQENRSVRSREHLAKRLGPWRRLLCGRTESLNTLVTRQLSCQIDPWRLADLPTGPRHCPRTRRLSPQVLPVSRLPSGDSKCQGTRKPERSRLGDVVKRSQRMCLATAELGD